MKAVEITAPGVVQVVERPEPVLGRGQALLRVRRVGFCGSLDQFGHDLIGDEASGSLVRSALRYWRQYKARA